MAQNFNATEIIARVLALPDDTEPLDLDEGLTAVDLAHVQALRKASMAARPTWGQEKRWFKFDVERKHYARAIGCNV